MITNAQIKLIHSILPAELKEDKEAKAELVFLFTQDADRTSTKDLSSAEAEELIMFLKTGKRSTYAPFATFLPRNKQHMTMLSMCYELGWITFSEKLNRTVVDLNRLGGWLKKYGYLHKPLKEYNTKELPKLVTQFKHFVTTEIKKK